MGSCCIRKPRLVVEPDPAGLSTIIQSKSFKRIPTSIKIIPASPGLSSLLESEPAELFISKSENAEIIPEQAEHNNASVQNKNQLTASQTLKSDSGKDLIRRFRFSTNLDIPGQSKNVARSNNDSLASSDMNSSINSVSDHRRRGSHELLRFASSVNSSSQCYPSYYTRKISKSKNLDGKKKINQYKFLRVIGSGAFGKVFKIVDESMNYFAAKVYNKRVLKTKWIGKKKTAWDSVKSEIEIMASVDHPNIIKLYEVIDEDDSKKIYLIIELAEGGTLNDICPVPEAAAKKCFRDLMLGVEYLHNTKSIVHRDIKPQNLLIASDGSLKICDFGGAQLVQAMRDELCNSSGTFMFMPPEAHRTGNFRGKPADIWACGITLYYILTKKSPFLNRTYSAIIEEINESTVKLPEEFSDTLNVLITKMTEKDPFKRIDASGILQHPWLSSC